jgi:hypothetical protein
VKLKKEKKKKNRETKREEEWILVSIIRKYWIRGMRWT